MIAKYIKPQFTISVLFRIKVARGLTACMKTYPENLTATSIGFQNLFPKIF